MPFLASVHLNNVVRVDWQVFVGIYDNTEETRVSLQIEKEMSECHHTHIHFITDPCQITF